MKRPTNKPVAANSLLREAFRTLRGPLVSVAGISLLSNLLVLTGPLFMMLVYDKVLASFCKIVDEPTFCEGVAALIDPICNDYLENRVVFVQYYLMPLGYWEDARRILQSVLDEPIGDAFPLYNGLNQQIAAELLAEVAKHL